MKLIIANGNLTLSIKKSGLLVKMVTLLRAGQFDRKLTAIERIRVKQLPPRYLCIQDPRLMIIGTGVVSNYSPGFPNACVASSRTRIQSNELLFPGGVKDISPLEYLAKGFLEISPF
jgi:hypothetical protein